MNLNMPGLNMPREYHGGKKFISESTGKRPNTNNDKNNSSNKFFFFFKRTNNYF